MMGGGLGSGQRANGVARIINLVGWGGSKLEILRPWETSTVMSSLDVFYSDQWWSLFFGSLVPKMNLVL